MSTARRALPPPPRNKDSLLESPDSQVTKVSACLRSFEHHIPLKHDAKYTYAIDPSPSNIVYFFEYHGYDVPSRILGAMGDTYVDLTHNSYVLYAKTTAGWVRWTPPAVLEHPFLTDTILSLSLEGVIWDHPMMVDKHSQNADIHRPVHVLYHEEESLCHKREASRKPPEADIKDNSNAASAGNNPRKRLRVDEKPSLTARISDTPTPSPSPQQLVQIVSESPSLAH